MITVKNRRTYRGPGVYIGRPSVLGNPYPIQKGNPEWTREKVVEYCRYWLKSRLAEKHPEILNELMRLMSLAMEGDLILICWCAPLACHGDVIKECLESLMSWRKWEGFEL
jgi:hypothetical protein